MSKRTVTQQKNNAHKKSIAVNPNMWSVLPIVLVVTIVPLIVYLKVAPLEGIVADYWVDSEVYDFYSYYKALFFCLTTLLAMLTCCYLYFKGNIPFRKSSTYIPIALFSLFILLSTLLAEHKSLALMGYPERYAVPAVLAVAQAGIIEGIPVINVGQEAGGRNRQEFRFNPNGMLTRDQLAVIAVRLLKNQKLI